MSVTAVGRSRRTSSALTRTMRKPSIRSVSYVTDVIACHALPAGHGNARDAYQSSGMAATNRALARERADCRAVCDGARHQRADAEILEVPHRQGLCGWLGHRAKAT